jgi:hypothetical protein
LARLRKYVNIKNMGKLIPSSFQKFFPLQERFRFIFVNHSLIFFLLFFLLNACLSWIPGSIPLRLVLWAITFILLFFASFVQKISPASSPLWTTEVLPRSSPWILALLFFLALGPRLYKVGSLSIWPCTDEGSVSLFSLQLAQSWHWNFFFNFNFLPPFFFWLLALYFKIFTPSLFSYWLFTVPFTMATLTLGFLACRRFCSQSLSLLWALLWGFSFWPLYMGRFNIPPILIPLWECGCLLLLGYCLPNPPKRVRLFFWLLLGLGIGTGFYTYFSWPFVALPFFLALGSSFLPWGSGRPGKGIFYLVLLICLITVLPLSVAHLYLPLGFHYFHLLWAFQNGFNPLLYLQNAASFLICVFWGLGSNFNDFAYRPLWGGLLNPLLGSFFFLGLIELFRQRKHPFSRWFLAAFFLSLSPIFLTNNLEMFRIIQILPLLLFCVALGFQVLLKSLKKNKRVWILAVFSFASFGMDFYHLGFIYPHLLETQPEKWSSLAKQRSCYNAYKILTGQYKAQGPGLILDSFVSLLERDPTENSLTLACFSFDAGRNPQIGISKSNWAALLVSQNDLPFLHPKFSQASWYDLGIALNRPEADEHFFMVVFPLDAENRPTFIRWAKANNFLQEIIYQSLTPVQSEFRNEISKQMLRNYGLFRGDRFLETHFWETLADNYQNDGLLENAWHALQMGLQKGFPQPRKYYLMGYYLFQNQHYFSAREAYLAAARLDARFTPPPGALKELNRLADREKRNGLAGVSKPLAPPVK